MSIPENISSLTSNSLVNSAKNKLSPKNIVKSSILNRKEVLTNRILDLEKRVDDVNKEYDAKFKALNNKFSKSTTISVEEKEKEYNELQKKKDEELSLIQNEIINIKNELINDIQIDNPLKNYTIELNKFKNKNKNRVKRTKGERTKADRDRIKSTLGNTSKTLAENISLLLTNQIVNIVTNDDKLQDLVNKTNETIDAADTQQKLNQARVLRNSALNILNTQQNKVKRIQSVIKTLLTVVRVLSILVRVLSLIPQPPFSPPKLTVKLIQATKLLNSLNVILSIINPILQSIIDNIERLKAELKQIGDLLADPSLIGLNGIDLSSAINLLRNPIGGENIFGDYKGFRFEIRTEENLGPNRAVVVNGIKRKFAVAINSDNVVVVQSDYSFTQDPNDLIEQIKLIIDQRNLKA